MFLFLSYYAIAQITPTWSSEIDSTTTFSSPRCMNLNNDDILDIVLGVGSERQEMQVGFVAVNGADGSLLWTQNTGGLG